MAPKRKPKWANWRRKAANRRRWREIVQNETRDAKLIRRAAKASRLRHWRYNRDQYKP